MNKDKHYPNFRILDLRNSEDLQRLHLLILKYPYYYTFDNLDEKCESDSNKDRNLDEDPLAPHFFDLLNPCNPRGIGARWCIVENDYVDRDSATTYARLFSRAFKDYPRRTVRLHFFSNRLETLTFEDFLCPTPLQKAYLGFMVLSPRQSVPIGRTVLPAPRDAKDWYFIPTQQSFSVNLAGIPLEARGTPFIQQDGQIAACASAAIWMSTTALTRRFHHDMLGYSMADITTFATEHSMPFGGVVSPPGLSSDQILWALHRMGYEPMCFFADKEGVSETFEIIIRSIESGIPPILLIGLPYEGGYHAVTAVGYTYNPVVDSGAYALGNRTVSSIWYPYFLIHDDQMGAYLKMTLTGPNPCSEGKPGLKVNFEDSYIQSAICRTQKWYKEAFLCAVILAHPPRHTLDPVSAYAKAIGAFFNLALSKVKIPISFPIYRLFLASSNEWKESMIPENRGGRKGLVEDLARYYRGHAMSRYIWVLEVYDYSKQKGKELSEFRVSADVILDPTSDPQMLDFISVHLPGLLIKMNPEDKNINKAIENCIEIENDTPYQPYFPFSYQKPASLGI